MPQRFLPATGPIIAPSMLKCDYARLGEQIAQLDRAGAKVLHWDVMDGHFVPNLSYGAMVIAGVRKQTNLFFDAHLMISDPEKYLDDYVKAGCDAITVHIEAVPDPRSLLKRIRSAGVLAGLAINPKTSIDGVMRVLDDVDLVLIMSVEPGFGGQSFMPEVLPKLEHLKKAASPRTLLSIDGGIGPATIQAASQAGARLFVAGSSVFDTSDFAHAMDSMAALAASA